MNKIILFFLIGAITLSSCKKDCVTASDNELIPSSVISINQKRVEISKTTGNTASIVLVSGFGNEFSVWQNLYKNLPNNATVFTYNRAGIGMSENISGSRDARTIANEMKIVLEANNIKPPYVLVAHSMGGIYARMFYHLNPSKVKGLVLVDATHENQLDSLLSMIPQPDRDIALAAMIAANDTALNQMPAGAMKEEFRANFSINYQQIKQYTPITNIPMYVITSTKISAENPPIIVNVHKALHEQWALNAGINGRFLSTHNSGHYIHVEEPGLVAEGIRWILSK